MLREAVRAVCDDKIAPHAAEVDETGEFPQESYDALRKADFHAVHIPEEYGGAGADALATCIVIEEVARACASTSLIPAVNKLGTMPLLLSASEDLLKRYLPRGGQRRGDVLLRALRAGGRQRRGGDADPRGPRRRPLRAQRREALDHQRGRLGVLHGDGRDRPRRRGQRHLRVRGREVRRGLHVRRAGEEARHQGLADPRALLRRLPHPGRPADRRGGHRLQDRAAHARPHPGHHRRAGGRHRAGRARLRRRRTPRSASSSASRSPSSRASSSCSPTWP